ncbi:MAG: ABC transporter substrate-binding protein [Mogibacterium sp.]|nr:ABC transporter substrate-binding protein [Mogibacterium sp.]
MKLRLLCVFAVCCMAAGFAGCTTFDSFRNTFIDKNKETAADPVIMIGVYEPLTGKNSDKGKQEVKGIELANSIYKNVDGYRVELTKVDTQSKVSTAKTVIQGLIEMKPVAIIGSAGEATSLAAAEYINDAGIPAITPSATNPLITQRNGFYFRACMTESQMGNGLAEYACGKIGSRKVGVVSLKNDSSTAAILDGFDERVKKIAGKRKNAVAYTAEINATEEEMDKALNGIKKKGVNVCFVGMGTEAMDGFFTMAEDKGLTGITYLGTRSWGNSDFIAMMEKHPQIRVVFPYESVLSGSNSTSDAQTKEAQRFQIEYSNRYGNEDIPTDNAALGYDSYLILINAIHNAKSVEGKDIRDAMNGLKELKCATGIFSFDDRGNVVRSVNLSTIKDGKPVSEYVTKTETEAKTLNEIENSVENEDNAETSADGIMQSDTEGR